MHWDIPKDNEGNSRSFTEAELLPCPFCEEKPYYERLGNGRQSCIVACGWCGCRLESNEQEWTNGWNWNRRGKTPKDTSPPDGVVLFQSPYKLIQSDHVFQQKQFTGTEPKPHSPAWNHGDGAPDWKNSGWVYDGILYPCTFEEKEKSLAIARNLDHQYSIDFQLWAEAKIELLENEIKLLKMDAK